MPIIRDHVGDDGDWRMLPDQWITFAANINGTPYTYGSTTTNPYYIHGNNWSWDESSSSTLWSPWVTTRGNIGDGGNYGNYTAWIGPRFVIAEQEVEWATIEIEAAADEVARRERLQAEREERTRSRTAAIARGEELLLSMLDENQREAYRQDDMFAVIGSCGAVYRIHRGVAGNIEWIKPDGTRGGLLCAHPTMHDGWLPTPDVMLAQMLALIHDEPGFLRVANVHAGQRPPILAVAA